MKVYKSSKRIVRNLLKKKHINHGLDPYWDGFSEKPLLGLICKKSEEIVFKRTFL